MYFFINEFSRKERQATDGPTEYYVSLNFNFNFSFVYFLFYC